MTAGSIYMITQLAKMLFLATVFPVPLDEDDDDLNAEVPFDFLMVRIKLFCLKLLKQLLAYLFIKRYFMEYIWLQIIFFHIDITKLLQKENLKW